MPAIARLPSGTLVEVLCGQPEQKNGVRATGGAPTARFLGFEAREALAILAAIRPGHQAAGDHHRATAVGVSSPSLGRIHAPLSSNLPITAGAGRPRQL
jgi:hypothetical protein